MNKNLKGVVFFSFIFLVVDQILKIFLSNYLNLGRSIILIKNLLSITLVHNEGAAFGLFSGNKLLLIIIGILVVAGVLYYVSKIEYDSEVITFIYALLIGGVLGNLIDRIFHGYVIDYISFKFGSYLFPVFNFADICIVISVALILLSIIKEDLWKY